MRERATSKSLGASSCAFFIASSFVSKLPSSGSLLSVSESVVASARRFADTAADVASTRSVRSALLVVGSRFVEATSGTSFGGLTCRRRCIMRVRRVPEADVDGPGASSLASAVLEAASSDVGVPLEPEDWFNNAFHDGSS